jgi:predicted Zn-dependent peptidase
MRQFYQERDVVMEERRMRYEDDPEGKLYESLLQTAYKLHPYRNPVIGYDRDIRKLTASAVADFHAKYYVPGNIVISAVGDVDPDRDIEMIKKYFGRLPAAPVPPHNAVVEPDQNGERKLWLGMKTSPQMAIAYHKPQYPDPDDARLSVAFQMLAESDISPLYTELVKKSQVAASVSYEEAPGIAYPNLALFSIVPKAPHTNEEALKLFDKVVERFAAGPVSEERLDMAKRSIAMDYLGHMRSNVSLALDFASSELLQGGWRALIDWFDEAMKVSTADVQRVTRKYLVKKDRTVAYLETKQDKTKKEARHAP